MFIGRVNGLFNVDAINCKFNRNTKNDEEESVFLRNDIATISPKGKAMNTIERLMKQKDFIIECKDSLLEKMSNDENGYCSADITKKIEEYEKQLDSLDEQIAKEMAKQTDETEKEDSGSIYKKNQSLTKQEVNNKKMADISKMSTELGKSEVINSVENRLEGEKGVLKAELKSGDSEIKRQRIEEIDNRTAELSKDIGETLVRVNEISKEGQEHFQNQVENETQGTFSDQNLDWKKVQQDSIYDGIIEKSDNGFNNPTIEMELCGTYNVYLNEAYEQGKAPEVNIYDHIVNIHKDSLMKAYQDVYNDIVTGYENGTREIWTQDFEEGADYIEFELEGKNYRFHKLTMEEELTRLDRAYEKVARIAEDGANRMINTQKILEKVRPEYQEKMREIEAQRAGRKLYEMGESAEMTAERVKDKLSMTEQSTERINLFEMLMEARKNWLNARMM